MSDTYFPVRYSQLDPDVLRNELIKRYELEEPVSCRVFDSGMNDIYIIQAGKEKFFLRISLTGIHKRHDYEEELFIINTLWENGIHTATPLPCKDKSFLWEINAQEGKRYAVLFTEAKKAPSDDNAKKSFNLGQMLAQIHMIADEKNFTVSRAPIDLVQLAKKPLELIYPHLAHRIADYEYLNNATEKLCRYVEEHLSNDKPYYGYCHGDIHTGNVFFEGDEPKVFDFDCMGYGWRAYDICVYAWDETLNDEKYMEKESWNSFLDGYNAIRKLSDIELSCIPVFAALREIWLMGLHSEVIKRNAGCSWYNDSYFDRGISIFKLWYERAISNIL